jgi:hypothetical protein
LMQRQDHPTLGVTLAFWWIPQRIPAPWIPAGHILGVQLVGISWIGGKCLITVQYTC